MIIRFIMKFWGLFAMVATTASTLASLPPLKVKGMQMVDPKGRPVVLKGVNVGNWHVIEMWMLGLADSPGAPEDQHALEALLAGRFGEQEKNRLMDVYRSSWITAADFKRMPSFGFNVVRLPMNYRLLEEDRKPFTLRPGAWKWIDRAIDLAEASGLYTILDMHGAQGGQSPYDHTGHANQNRLKDDVQAQRRLAWLWGQIAKRYRNRSAVLAYDVFNEPYGTPKPIQVKVFKMALAEIRKQDPDKLVIASGNYDDFDHYGDPKANGWKNVGFQMHYYPGMFGGGPPNVPTHVRHLEFLETLAVRTKRLNVPFLIGEMNVVFDSAGGAQMMRRYYDVHARYGWMTTMWSWKVVSKEGGVGPVCWGAVVNKNPMRTIDFRSASARQIEDYFRRFATEPVAVNLKLREALTSKRPLPPLPPPPPKRTVAPQDSLAGWNRLDIGGALAGGLKNLGEGRFELYGGGADVWGAKDETGYLCRTVEGDFVVEVEIDSVEYVDTYTKAGIMLRASDDPGSPTVLLTTFPSGEVQFAHRSKPGAEMKGGPTVLVALKRLRLRIARSGDMLRAAFCEVGKDWRDAGSIADPFPRRVLAGALALSHDASQLAKIVYRSLTLRQ